MGAQNSTPHTARIENPQRGMGIQVTPSVISRLDGIESQMRKKAECLKCQENQKFKYHYEKSQEMPQNWVHTQEEYRRKYNELEEYQFEKCVEKVKAMIGESTALVADVDETINSLTLQLINCYINHPKQSLNCASMAKEYQDFIFGEQYKAILKSNEQF